MFLTLFISTFTSSARLKIDFQNIIVSSIQCIAKKFILELKSLFGPNDKNYTLCVFFINLLYFFPSSS